MLLFSIVKEPARSFNMLATPESCQNFVNTRSAEEIAEAIQQDEISIRNGGLPSLIARYLPSPSFRMALDIAKYLSSSEITDPEVLRLVYESRLTAILNNLDNFDLYQSRKPKPSEPSWKPTKAEYDTTLKVLEYFQKKSVEPDSDVLGLARTILEADARVLNSNKRSTLNTSPILESQLSGNEGYENVQPRFRNEYCYICRYSLRTHHPLYRSLCRQCGDFNIAERNFSLPENLKIEGFISLVTGARINLGFHTAVRLLRCGAKVIVTTRYPRDAEQKYKQMSDWHLWKDRLRIVGADFRTSRDAFSLIEVVRSQVEQWGGVLHILINNAAQTLTDSEVTESQAIFRERQLLLEMGTEDDTVIEGSVPYQPRVRGVVSNHLLDATPIDDAAEQFAINHNFGSGNQLTNHSKSSWMQSMHEIPYEDLMTALAVNSIVPAILIRELTPLMGSKVRTPSPAGGQTSHPRRPVGYIVNVSSREGIFEQSPTASAKNGKHVHTNMSKAAMNMITATEAAPLWQRRGIAMNSVDPGYMSAAPEIRQECPITWEDGAGRVLWPVAMGERKQPNVVWGRFLKHYGKVDVNIGDG